jgi:DNA-binding NarL/FixJ family response regulator
MSQGGRIRILLVDDQLLMREGLRILLEMEPDLVVVGEAEDGEAALKAYAETRPDIVLMDIRMPGMDGVEATALGYLLKDVSGAELAEAVRTVAGGGALIEPSVARKVVAEFARLATPGRPPNAGLSEPLSEREKEILGYVAQGFTNREIAQRLNLAEGTVKNYVTAVLQKLGVRDRTQAALRARELGIL